jgi:hypothetical protein
MSTNYGSIRHKKAYQDGRMAFRCSANEFWMTAKGASSGENVGRGARSID